jgi:hypothetical protein
MNYTAWRLIDLRNDIFGDSLWERRGPEGWQWAVCPPKAQDPQDPSARIFNDMDAAAEVFYAHRPGLWGITPKRTTCPLST